MDTSRTLPALQNGDKWNANGVTGLQLQVERELPNVDMQFCNAISSTFDFNPLARDLALELLYRSKKFALDLCNFIQRYYDFWKHKGYAKAEAWELTCLSVRRIFEDIHVAPFREPRAGSVVPSTNAADNFSISLPVQPVPQSTGLPKNSFHVVLFSSASTFEFG